MSDSEASEFRFDDSDSDGFVEQPVKAKKVAAPKKAAATAKATKVCISSYPSSRDSLLTTLSAGGEEGCCTEEGSSCCQEEPSQWLWL